jgi:protein required for attachment to host cells
MKKIFYLITNSCRAQVFIQTKSNGPLIEIKSMEHRESRLRNLDIDSDKPGRTQHGTRNGMRGSMEPRTTPKETERRLFAREVAECLSQIAFENPSNDIILVAPPQFLGLLRPLLPRHIASRIMRTIDKDLTTIHPHILPQKISNAMHS